MYAVIKTGGKQYRVAADEVLTIEKIAGDAGATVEFTEVLMVGGEGAKPRSASRRSRAPRSWPRWSSRAAAAR